MPSRNRIKQWAPEQTYHIYNRGNNKQRIFLDQSDYATFINLIKRHLRKKRTNDLMGRPYKNWHGDIELLGFCLMPNHYHLLLYQVNEQSISNLIRSIGTSY